MTSNTHDVLAALVSRVRCKPGWEFRLDYHLDSPPELIVTVRGTDSSRPDKNIPKAVQHHFPVPWATYSERAWRRWIFECCRGVENHELGEWFRDGTERPFSPLHGPGELPYVVHEFRPAVDALTTQDGSVREPYSE